jgi:hypothetical protein
MIGPIIAQPAKPSDTSDSFPRTSQIAHLGSPQNENSFRPNGLRPPGHNRRLSSGKRCNAHPRANDRFCFFHSPDTIHARKKAQRAGGIGRSRRANVLPAGGSHKPLRNATEVAEFLSETINEVRVGHLDPRVANAVGYLATVHLKALEQGPMQERLVRIESALGLEAGTQSAKSDREFRKDASANHTQTN